MTCNRYLISGQVQGVFYRAGAQHQASLLDLCGWVRNLADGRVELLACGDRLALVELEKWLKIGPEYAKVSNIKVIAQSPEVLPSNFEIRPTSSLSE